MLRGDERAAGVISGSDPYKELELYLEKVSVSHFRTYLLKALAVGTSSSNAVNSNVSRLNSVKWVYITHYI